MNVWRVVVGPNLLRYKIPAISVKYELATMVQAYFVGRFFLVWSVLLPVPFFEVGFKRWLHTLPYLTNRQSNFLPFFVGKSVIVEYSHSGNC